MIPDVECTFTDALYSQANDVNTMVYTKSSVSEDKPSRFVGGLRQLKIILQFFERRQRAQGFAAVLEHRVARTATSQSGIVRPRRLPVEQTTASRRCYVLEPG
jgi:hypothetical protein